MKPYVARRIGVFFRLDTDVPVRLWAGDGDQRLPTSAIEPDPANLYLGCGELIGVPELNMLVNGKAQRVDFTLGGDAVTLQVLGVADQEAEQLRGVEAHIGIRRFDDDEQGLGPVRWLWHGRADTVTVSATPGEGAETLNTVGLGVGSVFTFRQRMRPAFWTGTDQRRRSADDAFCDHAAGYSDETGKVWKTT